MSRLESLTVSAGNGDSSNPVMDEKFGVELVPDPAPNERPVKRGRRAASKPAPRAAASKSVATLQKEVAEDITTVLEMLAAAWGFRDDCCAPVLEDNAATMGKAYAAILAKNPRMLQALAGAGVISWGLVITGAVKATQPVAKAVYQNHFAGGKTGEHDHGGGVNLSDFPVYAGPAAVR